MTKLEIKKPESKPHVKMFKEMEEGDIGRIVGGVYDGEIVTCRYDKIFSLNHPSNYWGTNAAHAVELLEPGTQVILTVE